MIHANFIIVVARQSKPRLPGKFLRAMASVVEAKPGQKRGRWREMLLALLDQTDFLFLLKINLRALVVPTATIHTHPSLCKTPLSSSANNNYIYPSKIFSCQ
jgi:hypothetical protein